MKIFVVALCWLVILSGGTLFSELHASSSSSAVAEYEAILKACWEMSETHRASPNASIQNKGTRITQDCMLENIIRLVRPMFETEREFAEWFLEPLHKSKEAYQSAINALYFDHSKCPDACGMIGSLSVAASMVDFYKPILRDAVYQNRQFVGHE